jgi:hypothetical protein
MRNDLLLALACITGLIAVTFALVRVDGAVETGRTDLVRAPVFGELEYVHQGLRRRPARALGWEALDSGDVAHERDTLFVPPGGSAVLRTRDGARLVLEEYSLVVLESGERPSVEVSKGSVTGVAAKNGLVLASEGRRTELKDQSSVRLEKRRVSVLSGDALIATTAGEKRLSLAQTATADDNGALDVATYAVVPASPAPAAQIFTAQRDAVVTLAWKPKTASPARVQIALSPDFKKLAAEIKVDGEALAWKAQGKGTHYWRLVSETGEPLSPVSSFSVLANDPPQPLSPRHLEQVTAPPPKIAVPFSWTRVDGAQRYVLEVARDVTFSQVDKQVTVSLPNAIVFGLPEATYHWRVHAEGDRPPSPPSPPRAFKLTHKPLVGAPELFDAEVELNAP